MKILAFIILAVGAVLMFCGRFLLKKPEPGNRFISDGQPEDYENDDGIEYIIKSAKDILYVCGIVAFSAGVLIFIFISNLGG